MDTSFFKGIKFATGCIVVLLIAFSVVYGAATWGSLPSVTSGSVVSYSAWNDIVSQLNTLASAMSISSGNVTFSGFSNSKFEGFSVYRTSGNQPLGWNQVTYSDVEYDTFWSSFSTSTSYFTAPKAGYYRFNISGWCWANTAGGDRVALWLMINGSVKVMGGGQFSLTDSPLGSFTHVVKLNAGDTVGAAMYSSIANVPLGSTDYLRFWFQGEYLGK